MGLILSIYIDTIYQKIINISVGTIIRHVINTTTISLLEEKEDNIQTKGALRLDMIVFCNVRNQLNLSFSDQ